jgi:hypothetical protein
LCSRYLTSTKNISKVFSATISGLRTAKNPGGMFSFASGTEHHADQFPSRNFVRPMCSTVLIAPFSSTYFKNSPVPLAKLQRPSKKIALHRVVSSHVWDQTAGHGLLLHAMLLLLKVLLWLLQVLWLMVLLLLLEVLLVLLLLLLVLLLCHFICLMGCAQVVAAQSSI